MGQKCSFTVSEPKEISNFDLGHPVLAAINVNYEMEIFAYIDPIFKPFIKY